jgi:hypothetical protein
MFLLCLLSLYGCAPATSWTKPGVTPEIFAKDSEACRREAARTAFAGRRGYILIHSPDFYYECLAGKGYVPERAS